VNKQDTIATIAARHIVRIGPDTTTGQMIALLSEVAREGYEAGEERGWRDGIARGLKALDCVSAGMEP
jgi:hypothetical protein